jgi:hypothetical protein
VPIDSSNHPGGQVAVSLFLGNARTRVRCDQPPQKSSANTFPVVVCRLAGMQFDAAEMFDALICVLLGAEQANWCAVVAIEHCSAEVVSQRYVRVERIV